MNIDEYIQLIKEKFDFLFEKHEFNVVYVREVQNRHRVFRVGLLSSVCKILFVREQGAGVSFLGTLDAPFENEMNEQWVSLMGLLGYILKEDFDWTFLDTLSYAQRIEASLSFSSSQFKPYCKQMMEMFSSLANVASWKSAYKQYVKEKVHRSILK